MCYDHVSACPYVRLTTNANRRSVKTVERVVTQIKPHDSTGILMFDAKDHGEILPVSSLTGTQNTRLVANICNFQQITVHNLENNTI